MRILITGGAGCLGSNLLEFFLPLGIEVMSIDNYATGKEEVLPDMPNFYKITGTVSDKALIDDCFDKFAPTHVIHSAASYKDPEDWHGDAQVNIEGTINIVRASDRLKVKKLVYFQTALCYGRPQQIPIPISHSLNPFTSYGVSKTTGEKYVFMGKTPAVSLRLANVTGPRLAIGPIPTFYKRIKEGKSCFCSDTVRDFLDMSDFISLMEIIMFKNTSSGIFNVSTGEGHSIREIFDIVAQYLKISPPEPPTVPCGSDDVPAVVLDPKETEQAFEWKAQVSFRDTIFNMLKWYDDFGVNDVYSHLARNR